MRRWAKTGLWILIGTLTLTTLRAQAYDEDTHFYGTYAMARYAGIRHEVAVKMALTAQWMDESYISDPTSMILLPVTGIKKRRLLHFPSSRQVGQMNAGAQSSVLGLEQISGFQEKIIEKIMEYSGSQQDLKVLNFLTETQEDHAFASEMLMEGLKKGNLMLASASLHVLEDSFAHAGTPAEQGHASFWHWPDRPFASPEKYARMVKTVMKAIVAIRTMLPAEALDCSLRVNSRAQDSAAPNCQWSAADLANSYLQHPAVRSSVFRNVLHEGPYLQVALRDVLGKAREVHYLNISEKDLDLLTNTSAIQAHILALQFAGEEPDANTIFARILRQLVDKQMKEKTYIVNLFKMLDDMGRLTSDSDMKLTDYIDSFGDNTQSLENLYSESFQNFARVMSNELLRWHVPSPLTDSHRMEVEDDKSPIRAQEMEMRVENARKMIETLFGNKIKFVANNSKDAAGFEAEVFMEKTAEAAPAEEAGVEIVTFQLFEKNAFDFTIFRYLFPSLQTEDLKKVATVARSVRSFVEKRSQIQNSNAGTASRLAQLAALDAKQFLKAREHLKLLTPLIDPFLNDTFNSRVTPSPDNFVYRNPQQFAKYQQEGRVKTFLQKSDVWAQDDLLKTAGK